MEARVGRLRRRAEPRRHGVVRQRRQGQVRPVAQRDAAEVARPRVRRRGLAPDLALLARRDALGRGPAVVADVDLRACEGNKGCESVVKKRTLEDAPLW